MSHDTCPVNEWTPPDDGQRARVRQAMFEASLRGWAWRVRRD